MECISCKTPVPDGDNFCGTFGANVSNPTGATTATLGQAQVADMECQLRELVQDEFEVEREIGRGGMAAVYLAREIHLNRQVAIKVLPPELTFGHGAIDRFKREAMTAAQLDHVHIIPIYRVAVTGKLFWYAMKYLEGTDLSHVLEERKRLPLDETVAILTQVASALDYAHERTVIHRDVKPANIMLDTQNRVIVTDFGIAKQLDTAGSLTASGSVLGTPYYMSPEQCTGGVISGAADQYSLAVMTFQMLSGELPFDADSGVELLTKHVMTPPPPLKERIAGLPSHVYDAVNKGLAKKPEGRFATVSGFVDALQGATHGVTTTDLPLRRSLLKSINERVVTVGKSRRWLALTVSTLSIGVIGVWLMMMLKGAEQSEDTLPTSQQELAVGARAGSDSAETPGDVSEPTMPAAADVGAGAPSGTRPSPPVLTTGSVVVANLPGGGQVSVDGTGRRGTSFDLSPGSHVVRLAATGFETMEDTVDVIAGETTRLRFSRTRQQTVAVPQPVVRGERPTDLPATSSQAVEVPSVLRVAVNVSAQITIDGVMVEEDSRRHIGTLSTGVHLIRVVRQGFTSLDTTVTASGGDTLTIRLTLREASYDDGS